MRGLLTCIVLALRSPAVKFNKTLSSGYDPDHEHQGYFCIVLFCLMFCFVLFCAHRDVGFGLGAVELKRKIFLLAVEGAQPLGPDRRDKLLVLQLPVEIEDPVQVHSQTSAFINDDSELLQLPHSTGVKNHEP